MTVAIILTLMLIPIVIGVTQWIVRRPYDPFNPDSRRYRGDWALWRMQLNRKDEMQ